jgi:excisionase family DNA binding protein
MRRTPNSAGAPGQQVQDPAPPRSLALLSVREAAAYARVSQQTIRRWIKTGSLKIYRAGRQIRIDENDLVDYISSGE